ncbi:helix-turn-helix domain-containing protein [Catellatospora sichuanensis]|uniref:helix-turn-helix domain-containing protein n=1 Tax=Catellatospora sichuanensis TaxID=1969805 RepID=UPI0011821BA4|nr:helix-turn-helix domain-containing protein [Catellatospora sichuanensis]
MPAPRLLPDNDVLVNLRRQGWTYADIAAQYGVSTSAVYLRLRNANATAERPSYKAMIPWTVKRAHTYAFPVQMLRLLARKEKGETLSPVRERMLTKWLREIEGANVVVAYDPECPPNPASPISGGFYYAPRADSDGKSIVRPPSVDSRKR